MPSDRPEQELQLRPATLDDYIGQASVCRQLRVFIAAAAQRGEPMDHTLLFGPPGLGKTTLAMIIATEMNAKLHITTGPALERTGDIAALMTALGDGDVLFIDEIHRLHPALEETMYSALEDFRLDIIIGEGAAARSVKIPWSNTMPTRTATAFAKGFGWTWASRCKFARTRTARSPNSCRCSASRFTMPTLC